MKNDLHLVCPHCQSINRVPTAKLSEHPNCGRCQQPLTYRKLKNQSIPLSTPYAT